MADHNWLIGLLRESAEGKTLRGCDGCNGACTGFCLFEEAADAIEELSMKLLGANAAIYGMQREIERTVVYGNKPKWVPVTERLPKYGERVLVFGGVTMYVAYYGKNRYGGESWHKLNSKSHYCNPTHWMPLPTPPEEE